MIIDWWNQAGSFRLREPGVRNAFEDCILNSLQNKGLWCRDLIMRWIFSINSFAQFQNFKFRPWWNQSSLYLRSDMRSKIGRNQNWQPVEENLDNHNYEARIKSKNFPIQDLATSVNQETKKMMDKRKLILT